MEPVAVMIETNMPGCPPDEGSGIEPRILGKSRPMAGESRSDDSGQSDGQRMVALPFLET